MNWSMIHYREGEGGREGGREREGGRGREGGREVGEEGGGREGEVGGRGGREEVSYDYKYPTQIIVSTHFNYKFEYKYGYL